MTYKMFYKIPTYNSLVIDSYKLYEELKRRKFTIITVSINNIPQIVVDFCDEDNIREKYLIILNYITIKTTGRRNIDISFTI
jgi:hypothetical protein